jgi:hypothetical protein
MFNDLTPLAPAYVGPAQQDFPPDAGPLAQAELIRLRLKINKLEQRMTDQAQPAAQAVPSDVLTDDMLRYAMGALGTGSPQEAERFRAFWLHALTARATNRQAAPEGMPLPPPPDETRQG